MDAVSTSKRFCRIERPLRNPCCLGSIQSARFVSQQLRAALATILFSVLTTLSGRVLLAVKMGVPSCVVEWDFLGRQAMKL